MPVIALISSTKSCSVLLDEPTVIFVLLPLIVRLIVPVSIVLEALSDPELSKDACVKSKVVT